jgi:hypothetical protein
MTGHSLMTWPVGTRTDGELLAAIADGDTRAEELRAELDARRVARRKSASAAANAYRLGRLEPKI